jgi:hypothetical protein
VVGQLGINSFPVLIKVDQPVWIKGFGAVKDQDSVSGQPDTRGADVDGVN